MSDIPCINPQKEDEIDPFEQSVLDAFTHCAMVLMPLSHEARTRVRNTLDAMFEAE